MKNFIRSLRYLRPYRGRLAVSCICVLLIAVLWAGGLGALLPAAKILISQEGLHGWAYDTMTQDRLGAYIVQRVVPAEPRHVVAGQEITLVLDVVELEASGPAAAAGVRETEWLIGLADARGQAEVIRGDELAHRLATAPAGRAVSLHVYDPQKRTARWTRSIALAEPAFSSRLLGDLVGPLPRDRFDLLVLLLAAVVVVTLLRNALRFFQEYLVMSAVFRGLMDLRGDSYNVLLHMPTTFFSQQGSTDSISRLMQDTAELGRGQVTLFGKTLVEPAKAIGAIGMALWFSWPLTLLAIVGAPPVFLLIRKLGKAMKKAARRALESLSAMLAILEETLTGIRVVKAYTMEASERKRFFRTNRQLYKQQRRMARVESASAPAVECLGIVAAMAAIAVAGYWVIHNQHQMDEGRFLALMGCLAAIYDPVRKLSRVATRFQRAEAAAARAFELQDRQQERRQPGAPALPRLAESLEFRNVRFRYPGAIDDALKEINLVVRAGETLAIVGPNGAGKTTLVSLVPRLLEPTEGVLLLDGRDVAEHSMRSLRRQIGLVTQETILFNATVAENISYGLRRPGTEEVLAAAKKAFVDEFVRELPGGYDTVVGERGATLSGGQRQRITIARAILRDPALLIFDEAMSQVDADSERRIHQAMEEFVKDRTTLLIAHRFATVLSADRVAVMNEGRIIDVGTHAELDRRCELYHHLYKTQFIDSGG